MMIMRRVTHLKFAAALLAALISSACANTTDFVVASSESDRQAKAFAPAAGKGAIYVYRLDGWRGSAGTFPVTVDGRLIGRIHNGTYYVFEVDPGEHEVWVGWDRSISRTVDDPVAAKLVLVPFNVVAGKTFFVRVAQTGQEHVEVPEQQAKQELLACCRRVADSPAQQQLFR